MNENVLIVGATSGIARALAHELARRGDRLVLAGRQVAELEIQAADLRVRYRTEAAVEPFDALDVGAAEELLKRTLARFGGDLTGAVIAFGYLGEQETAQSDPAETRRTIDANFTAAALALEPIAKYMAARGTGFLVGISSVAGDRGRQSNYLYGAAKAGLSAYLAGLRHRLHRRGVHVLTVKPGFVDTAMTWGRVHPRSPLLASPERVARDIVRALERRRATVYTPWFWRWVMLLIRALPEWVFVRTRL